MLISTLLKIFITAPALYSVNGAALPPRGTDLITSPDGYEYVLPSAYEDIVIEDGTVGRKFIYPPQSENPAVVVKRALYKRANFCGDSTFDDHSSGASPFRTDCMGLQGWMRTEWNDFAVTAISGWAPVVQYGNCIFGARASYVPFGVDIGNEDIADLIGSALDRFNWNKVRTGAEGSMYCHNAWGTTTYTEWAIFSSGG